MKKKHSGLNKTFGENLRKHRLLQNFSQEEFADICQMHRTYIGAIERFERNITLRTVETLASSLKLDPLVLLKETSDV